jgi:hypothetical protein
VLCLVCILHGSAFFIQGTLNRNFVLFLSTMIGVKNPISAARAVLEHSEKRDNIGRVPPLSVFPFLEVKRI